MKILEFTPEHEKYDKLTVLFQAPDLSKPFLMETWKMPLYRFLSQSLEHLIYNYDDFSAKDLKTLVELSHKLEINFGKLPEWVKECIEQRNEYYNKHNICMDTYETIHLLNSNLFSLPYSQRFLPKNHIKILNEQLGIERVYQLISIDRKKILDIPIYGRKIVNGLDWFKKNNFLDKITLKISDDAKN